MCRNLFSVSFLLLCFLNGAASGGEGTESASRSLQARICRTIAGGSHPVVIVRGLTGIVRGKLMKADDKGIAVLTPAGEVRVSWDEIEPKYLLRIAGKVLSDSAGDAEAVARYALEKHLAGESQKLRPAVREALARIRAADQSSAETETVTPGEPGVICVAPDGSNDNPGTRAEPFATLERARDEIRRLRKSSELPEHGVTVELRGGVYERTQPFKLTAVDSGTEAAPVVYRADRGPDPGGEVRLVGGKLVIGWERVTDRNILKRLDPRVRSKVLQADLNALGITDYGAVKGGGLELFFQDKPMTLARWPNEGFVRITDLVEGKPFDVRGTKGDKIGKFMYEGDRPRRWTAENDVWVHGYWFWDWADERHKVESIDTERRVISVVPPYHGYGYRVGQWFYGLNILAELDFPGEWYLDRETGILYFWPPASIEKGRPMVSVLETMVTMKGVSHVTLRGMTFEAARGTAITIDGGTQDRIVGCTFRNLGSWAVKISGGRANGVVGCDIYETGNGGIGLVGGERRTLTPAAHYAENNHIHHYGRWNRMYQPAISMRGVGSRATHNLIHNAPHMAIFFSGNDHLIEFNEIHSVCYESNDAGAVYAGRDWTMHGTVIRHNYLHHISGFEGRGCVGIYLDDMFCGTKIYGNLFYEVTRAAFIGGGRDCIVENNVFVDCRPALHIDARAMGWASYHVKTTMTTRLKAMPYKSELWRERYPKLVTILEDEPAAPKGNLVARNVSYGGRWDGVRDKARPYVTFQDNMVDRNPGFAAEPPSLGKWSFRLRRDSPAYRLGFKRIPIEKIGLYKDERRASWPVEHKVRPMPDPRARKGWKGPPPVFKVSRRAVSITVEGALAPDEWRGGPMLIEQGIRGEKAGPPSRAWLAFDDEYLFVAVDNTVDPNKPLRRGRRWGADDAMELALRNPAAGKKAPIFVLRGYAGGYFESSTEAGAAADAARSAGEEVKYAAKILGDDRWTAEWRIPFAGLAIAPRKDARLEFNLTVLKTAASVWLMWQGTGGYSWLVQDAGVIELAR